MAFLDPLSANPAGCLLRDARTGTVLATHVEIACDSRSRRRGLLGRDRLETGHALVIAPCGAIHTWFMRFAIDVLFVAKDGRVVKCAHDVKPWRMAVALTAHAAIETPAGTLRRCGAQPGDRLVLECADAGRQSSTASPSGDATPS